MSFKTISADQLELGTIKEQFSLLKMPRLECFKWRQVASPSSGAILGGHAGHSSPVHGHVVSQSQTLWLCKTKCVGMLVGYKLIRIMYLAGCEQYIWFHPFQTL